MFLVRLLAAIRAILAHWNSPRSPAATACKRLHNSGVVHPPSHLVQLFDEAHDVTLAAISVLDSSDHAVVRMIFDNADAARFLLRQHGFSFSEVELLVLELDDVNTLTNACLYLLGAEDDGLPSAVLRQCHNRRFSSNDVCEDVLICAAPHAA